MSIKKSVDPRRVRVLREGQSESGPVLYWMDREQRVQDNWALLYAQEQARLVGQPFGVMLTPYRERVGDNGRQAGFLIDGLKKTAADLEKLRIPLYLLPDASVGRVNSLLTKLGVSLLVADMSPLKAARILVDEVAAAVTIPVHQVDAHNIVPVWTASEKQEYAAYTIRPKINRLLNQFLTEFPVVGRQQRPWPVDFPAPDWKAVSRKLGAAASNESAFGAGSRAAHDHLEAFLKSTLVRYADDRNDPNADAQSNLSPYLNSGQLSAQRVALAAQRQMQSIASQEAFLEELIIRRELSDNFCWYNDQYDSLAAFPAWSRKTLHEHRTDPRAYVYSRDQWERAETHDELWNAAQTGLVATGKIHGYMRMYWAKKLLEWSVTPEEAFLTGVYLNDRFALDGNDPNGFAGVAWSVGGVHDRPWMEREVYGRVRYMNANGCARKFDVPAYISRTHQHALELR